MLADWFETPKGGYVLAWERGQFDAAVEDVFGYNAVQLGLPGLDFLRESRIPLKVRAGLEPGCGLRSEPVQLPLASQSIDLLALPHVLEFSAQPHALLREAERVLGRGQHRHFRIQSPVAVGCGARARLGAAAG